MQVERKVDCWSWSWSWGWGWPLENVATKALESYPTLKGSKKRLILNEHTSSSIGQVTSHMWPNKVCVVYLFTLLHMFEWFIAWLLVNKGHQNDMSYNVNLFIIPCLVVNLTWLGGLIWSLKEMKCFTVAIVKYKIVENSIECKSVGYGNGLHRMLQPKLWRCIQL